MVNSRHHTSELLAWVLDVNVGEVQSGAESAHIGRQPNQQTELLDSDHFTLTDRCEIVSDRQNRNRQSCGNRVGSRNARHRTKGRRSAASMANARSQLNRETKGGVSENSKCLQLDDRS